MNDRVSENATCPFFLSVMRGNKGKMIGVECESLDDNLGFDNSHYIRLRNTQDLKDFTEIFCCDRFEGCSYYKAIMNIKYKERI